MFSKIAEYSTLKNCLIFFVLFIIFSILLQVKPLGVEGLQEIVPNATILDLERGYSVDQAYAILEYLKNTGRAFYQKLLFFDTIFVFIHTIFFTLVLTGLFKQIVDKKSILFKIGIIAILIGILDLLENMAAFVLLLRFPERIEFLAQLASFFSTAKYQLIPISVLLVLVGMILVLREMITVKYLSR